MTTLRRDSETWRGSAGSSLAGSSSTSSMTIGPSRAASNRSAALGFFGSSVFFSNAAPSSSFASSSVSMATLRVGAVSATAFLALRSSARTCSFPGSIAAAFSRSASAARAFASPSPGCNSSRDSPRRASALTCSGSAAITASQSAMASRHRRSFMFAAARFDRAATHAGSSASASAYASTAEEYSLARKSSLPFSRSRRATHFRSDALAPAIAASVFSAFDAPGTERSTTSASFLEAESAKSRSAEAAAPPSSRPSARDVASANAASDGGGGGGLGAPPAEEEAFSSEAFLSRGPRATTVAAGTFRMGATPGPERGRTGAGSRSAPEALSSEVHRARSSRNDDASFSSAARVSGSRDSGAEPSVFMRCFTTSAVWGKPSCLRGGGREREATTMWEGARAAIVSGGEDFGRRGDEGLGGGLGQRRERARDESSDPPRRGWMRKAWSAGSQVNALHVATEAVELFHVAHGVDLIEADVVEELALVLRERHLGGARHGDGRPWKRIVRKEIDGRLRGDHSTRVGAGGSPEAGRGPRGARARRTRPAEAREKPRAGSSAALGADREG